MRAAVEQSGTPPPEHRCWRTSVALTLGSFAAYLLLQQPSAHGSDVFTLLRWLDEPGVVHPHHPLYLIAARAMRALVGPFGGDGMLAMGVLAALGAALSIGAVHRAALALRNDPTQALWLAIAVACTPTLSFFATVRELHTPFAAVAAMCFWATIAWARRSRLLDAFGVGVLCGTATLFHATGHVLVPLLAVAFAWLRRRLGWRSAIPPLLVFGAAHALVAFGVSHWLRAGSTLQAPDSASFLSTYSQQASFLPHVLPNFWREWLWAFFPLSVVGIAAFWQNRALAAAMVQAAALGYVVLTALLVQGITDEVGAYAMPMLFPAAVVAIESLPRRHWWVLAALGALNATVHRACHQGTVPDRAFGAAAAACLLEQPTVFLVGDEEESMGVRWYEPHAELIEAWVMLLALGKVRQTPISEAEALVWFELQANGAHSAGKRLVVTDRAWQAIAAHIPAFATAWERLPEKCRVERIAGHAGLAGYCVSPR